MTRSRSWISLFYLLFMSIFVTLGGVSSVAYAATKYHVNTQSAHWRYPEVRQAMNTSSQVVVKKRTRLYDPVLYIHPRSPVPQTSTQSFLTEPYGIPTSRKLRAPGGHSHKSFVTVHQGDTLWAIAVEHHTTVTALMAMNNLNSSLILPGQKLRLSGPEHKLTAYKKASLRTQVVDLQIVTQHGIPVQLMPVYQDAGQKYGIPWTVLAAIHRIETDFSTKPVVSGAGAEGPMQFMPSTFQHYAVKAPGHHGVPNIDNVYDAIYTAAHMLAADGYATNPSAAIYQYNHSMAYVQSVEALAQTYQV